MHFLRFPESGKIFIWNSADRAAAPDTIVDGDWSRANFAVHNKCYIGGPDPKANPNRSWFNGSMDEVMIFSRALTAEEVTRIYEAQK
jgi:hypothetical protein